MTPSADIDLAVRDVVSSAFGHAGQKCSAASLVVLVGSVARSQRFRAQLLDAVASLPVGYPVDATTKMGPLIEPAAGKLLDGLTRLGEGERWLLKPEQLDDTGRLWSPGVRDGVRRGSEYHRTEYFGPILGIMTADTLDEAIAIVDDVDYGLTSGLHSLAPDEIATWLERTRAGNLYVNRGIIGAIVRRQPFGGWKRSAVGAGTKAGGPHYLIGLADWESRPARSDAPISSAAADGLLAAVEGLLPSEAVTSLHRAARSDAAAWRDVFGVATDVSGLAAERNVLRYRATDAPVEVRLADHAQPADLARIVLAGVTAGARPRVYAADLSPALIDAFRAAGAEVRLEDYSVWSARIADLESGRVRLIGAAEASVTAVTGGRVGIAVYDQPVTESGRIELLPFLREQAVSITAHRFGTPDGLTEDLL